MLAWASGACILGTMCYALAGIYMRKYARTTEVAGTGHLQPAGRGRW